jgi:hypothetical protein
MKVGVLCEYSGKVRDAFLRRGHDAISCDLLPTESPGPHLQGDCLSFSWDSFDLLVCHPPCTYLSVSGLHWNHRIPGRSEKTEEALAFVNALMLLPVHRIAVENPVSIISSRIRKPDQIIQPYDFGHDASKATCLWLKNLPCLTPTVHVPPRFVNGKKRWGNQTDSGQNRLGPSQDRWKLRSTTFQGIADAMAEQWG